MSIARDGQKKGGWKTDAPVFTIRANVARMKFSPTLAMNERVGRARGEGRDILHMGFGESPFPVHPLIREALAEHADKNMYLPAAGLEPLRAAALGYFADKFGFDASGFSAVVGPGSKALIYALQAAVEGDLLHPVPSWVSYAPQAGLLADAVVPVRTRLADRLHLTASSLDEAVTNAQREGRHPTKLILNYPNNPSGLALKAERLKDIAAVCREHGLLVISDEIYGLVTYAEDHVSIARFYPEGTIVTTGLSKHLSLGGYRLGVALVPPNGKAVLDAVRRIASETWSCAPAPIQYAAVKAFERDPRLEAHIAACTRIHSLVSRFVRDAVVEMGVEYPELDGAFYCFPDFGVFRKKLEAQGVTTSERLAEHLLEKAGVATLPGTAFGDEPGNLTLRLSACDFDGEAALAWHAEHPDAGSEAFVRGCCPNVARACERLGEYFRE